jgi:hypothetical protein
LDAGAEVVEPVGLGVDARARVAEGPGGRRALAKGLVAGLGERAGARVERGDDGALDVGNVSRPRRRADLVQDVVRAEAEGVPVEDRAAGAPL